MAKEKQTRRMIAMALAAAVTMSSVPVVAFAEEVGGEGGSTTKTETSTDSAGNKTTTTTTTNSDGSSKVESKTENTDGSSSQTTTTTTGEGTVSAPTVTATVTITTNASGETTSQSEKTETSYSDTDSFGNTTDSTTVKEDHYTGTSVPSVPPAEDTRTEEEKTQDFVDNFQDGSTSTTETSGTESHETTTKTDKENIYNEATEDSGSVSGNSTSTTTKTEVEQNEVPVSDTRTDDPNNELDANKPQLLPDDQQPADLPDDQPLKEGEVDKERVEEGAWGDQYDVENDTPMTSDELKDLNDILQTEQQLKNQKDSLTQEKTALEAKKETGLTAEEQAQLDKVTAELIVLEQIVKEMELSASVNGGETVGTEHKDEESLSKDWEKTYELLAGKATETATNAAKAEAQNVKDVNNNVVTMGAVTTVSVPENNADGDYKYTSTGETDAATYVKNVTVTKVTDPETGNITFTTTTEVIMTPKAWTPNDGETKVESMLDENGKPIVVEDTTYAPVQETTKEPVTTVNMPEEPKKGEVSTEADTGKTMTTVDVKPYFEDINGVSTQVGYEKVVEIKNKDGEVIGTGTEIVKGTIVTTESTKTVEKTTTIDEYTQKTTVAEKEVVKQVTQSVVNMNMSAADRELIVKLLSAQVTGDHGDIDTLASIIASRNTYENLYTNDDLRNEMQWVGTNTTTAPNGSKDINKVTHFAQAGEFDLVGYGMYSDLLVWRDKANGDPMYGDVRQYILHDSEGNDFYTYCVEMGQGLNWGSDYVVENLDEVEYFKGGQEAKDHIRTIVLNGFWGTTGDTAGSMDSVKAMLKENGWTQTEVDTLTPGQAMAATQAAIWYYGNDGGQKLHDLDHIIRRSYNAGWVEENEIDNKNVVKMFDTLIGLDTTIAPEEKETNLIDLKDVTATITAKEKVADGTEDIDNDGKIDNKYNTDVSFTLAVIPGENDSLNVVVVDNKGNTLASKDLRTFGSDGENVKTTDANGNTTYTMKNIELTEGVTINLSIDGTQHLKNGVYIYRSENFDTSNVDAAHSQTMVGIAEGTRDVSLDMNLTFSVEDPGDISVDGSKNSHKQNRTDKKKTTENYMERETVVTALMEVTTTTVTEASEIWNGSYEETWSPSHGGNGGGDKDPEVPKDPGDPSDPEHFEDIGDNDVPLAGVDPEEPVDIGDEEVPLAAADEEVSVIAETGDSNHMVGAFGGMFTALAGMFMLRKKKEN